MQRSTYFDSRKHGNHGRAHRIVCMAIVYQISFTSNAMHMKHNTTSKPRQHACAHPHPCIAYLNEDLVRECCKFLPKHLKDSNKTVIGIGATCQHVQLVVSKVTLPNITLFKIHIFQSVTLQGSWVVATIVECPISVSGNLMWENLMCTTLIVKSW